MLKAYSVFNDFDKQACEILKNAGIQIELSNTNGKTDKKQIIRLLKEYDILIISIREKLTKDILDEIKNKKIIATSSVGLDHIDDSFFNTDLVKVVNSPKANVISVAEHIFSLILGLKKRIIEANDVVLKGGTKKDVSKRSNDINGSTIGVIGAGKISREVIKIAKAFNMKIYCNTLHPEQNKDLLEQNVEFVELDTLLKNSDIISINIPMTEENRNFISRDKIRLMKKTATFINTSRAEIVDVDELIKYADENDTFNVGLDIDVEKYKDILNIKRKNVIVTPHTAGVTQESVIRMDIELANNIVKCLGQ